VKEVPFRITRSNNFQHLSHIIENTTTLCCTIIVLMAAEPMLDFRERFLNRIEVRRVRRKIFNPDTCNNISDMYSGGYGAREHTKAFNRIYNLVSMVDFGIVHDENTQRSQKG
jgi:hypothetical protein